MGNAQSDAETYRLGYPGKIDPPLSEQHTNFDFYMNRIPSQPEGDYVDTIHQKWFGNYQLLEVHHAYIQWLFPIRELGMNASADPLTVEEAAAIRADPAARGRFIKSYELILDFYGMKLADQTTGVVVRAPNFASQYHNLNTSPHNYLRITRIIKCLGELGFEHFQLPFVKHLLEEILVHGELQNARRSALDYWLPVLRNDSDRHALEALVENHLPAPTKKENFEFGPAPPVSGEGTDDDVDSPAVNSPASTGDQIVANDQPSPQSEEPQEFKGNSDSKEDPGQESSDCTGPTTDAKEEAAEEKGSL